VHTSNLLVALLPKATLLILSLTLSEGREGGPEAWWRRMLKFTSMACMEKQLRRSETTVNSSTGRAETS